MLPQEVLRRVQADLMNWQGLGSSVMEISHRSHEFLRVVETAEANLRELLNIPSHYHVLYAQGGARGQFAAVPMNLLGHHTIADYVNSGYWAKSAIQEASKYCTPNVINVQTEINGQGAILPASEWKLSSDAAYVHFCPNETIDGIEIRDLPVTDKPLVADMSSTILSRPLDIEKYGVIYAGAQKNIGPAGLTLIIVRDDLLGRAKTFLPNILNYQTLVDKESMFNTPPTFAWYLAGEVYQWLKDQGGLIQMQAKNEQKAALLYDFIDQSSLYQNTIHSENRSLMNVPFLLTQEGIDQRFLQAAEAKGLMGLKGHRDVGGMRASIYNAMPLEGVQTLIEFMREFEADLLD